MTSHSCKTCRRHYTPEPPEKWTAKHPELKNLCPDCLGNWVSAHPEADV